MYVIDHRACLSCCTFTRLAFRGAVYESYGWPEHWSVCTGYKPSSVLLVSLQQENKGLREILQITRESFLNLRKDDASESTSLSAFVTNSDLSLRKSWVAGSLRGHWHGLRSEWMNEHKRSSASLFPSPVCTMQRQRQEWVTRGRDLDCRVWVRVKEWASQCCWALRATLNAPNKRLEVLY